MNKTPWFNALTQHPRRDGVYELKCPMWVGEVDLLVTPNPQWRRGEWMISKRRWYVCDLCQWRGLKK